MKGRGQVKPQRIDAGKRSELVRKIEAERPALAWPETRLAELHWYGLSTKAGAEFAVEAMLERAGIVALVPAKLVYRRVNRYVRQKASVSFPLLPRYVLVGFDANGEDEFVPPWRKVLELPIRVAPVGIEAELPWRMDGRKVAEFLKRNGFISAADAERYMRTHKEFAEGDEVDIVEGPFRGHRGRVHLISGREAKVLLPLFGNAEHPVPIALANLEKSA